jgi:hypothetical protein
MDNYGTHKHANVRAWLQGHPRFVCHFVPTSSSWLNLCGQHPVRAAHRAHRARRFPVRLQDLTNELFLPAPVVHASLLSLAARAATGL